MRLFRFRKQGRAKVLFNCEEVASRPRQANGTAPAGWQVTGTAHQLPAATEVHAGPAPSFSTRHRLKGAEDRGQEPTVVTIAAEPQCARPQRTHGSPTPAH